MGKHKHTTKQKPIYRTINILLIVAIAFFSVILVTDHLQALSSNDIAGVWSGTATQSYGDKTLYNYTITISAEGESNFSGTAHAEVMSDTSIESGATFVGHIDKDNSISFEYMEVYGSDNGLEWCTIQATFDFVTQDDTDMLVGQWIGLNSSCIGLDGSIELSRVTPN